MGLTRIVFVILATWSLLGMLAGAPIELSSKTSVIEYGRSYNLQCTVKENFRSREMSFSRKPVEICKRRASNINEENFCETFYNTSSYQCLRTRYYSDVLVYRITIKSFKEIDATEWWCTAKASETNGTDRLSNFVYLFYVNVSGNMKNFDANGTNSITFTCETSNITGSVNFTWIIKTTEGSTYIENNLTVSKHGNTYRQELKFIPHWYQHGNEIACKVLGVSTNITAMSNSEVLDLIYAPSATVLHDYNSSKEGLKVICEAVGRPENYSFSPFTHFWGEYRIRELPGQRVLPNKYVLTVQNVTYAESGRYQCGVSNGVEELDKIKVQTNFTLVDIGDKPIVGDEKQNQTVSAVLGKTVVLARKIFSNSNITRHTWTNEQGQNFTDEISSTTVTLRIYNTTVADVGFSVKMTISNLSNSDQGIYKLDVCNIHGCDQFYTTLNVVVSEPVTSDPILIPAASGAAGFVVLLVIVIVIICVIKKRRNSQTNKTDNRDDDYNTVNRTNAQRETGVNDDGNTSVIHDDKQRQEPVMVHNELYFVSRNARNQKPKPEADINDDEHASVNQKDKQEEPVMHDNELYFMSSSKQHKKESATEDELGPDEQGVDVKPEDASAMYSVVNKHRNRASDDNTEPTGNDINSMSSVANGEDKQPGDEDFSSLYSTVNKHPKTSRR